MVTSDFVNDFEIYHCGTSTSDSLTAPILANRIPDFIHMIGPSITTEDYSAEDYTVTSCGHDELVVEATQNDGPLSPLQSFFSFDESSQEFEVDTDQVGDAGTYPILLTASFGIGIAKQTNTDQSFIVTLARLAAPTVDTIDDITYTV